MAGNLIKHTGKLARQSLSGEALDIGQIGLMALITPLVILIHAPNCLLDGNDIIGIYYNPCFGLSNDMRRTRLGRKGQDRNSRGKVLIHLPGY